MVAVLVAPATAAVASPPAVDQYTQHLPDARGNSGPGSGDAPVARPELLSEETRAALSRPGRDGELLAQIATARDLGAPEAANAGAGVTPADGDGFATVVADTVLSAPGLLLIAALGGIALVAGWARSIRRGRSSSDHS